MWNYFPAMLKSLQELPEYRAMETPQLMDALFPKVHYIWMIRRDKVRQAVSWAKAAQTDVYAWSQGDPPAPKREPSFDFEFVDQLYNLIIEGEAGWRTFFETCGVRPFRVEYEELVKAYEPTALRILEYMKIPYPKNLVFGERRLRKQADDLNEAWTEKYIEMKRQANGGIQ
jgi:LPS sulfotransferase NodH